MFEIRSQLCDVFIISYGRREINTLLLSFDKTQKFISDIFTESNVSHETLVEVQQEEVVEKPVEKIQEPVIEPQEYLQEKVEEITSGSIHHRQHSVPYISLNSC